MKVHQVTHLFAPDQLAGASLYTDLARYLRNQGHDVRVTTTFSYYPALHYSDADRGVLYRDEEFESIKVRRVGMVLPEKHSGWRRIIPEITYLSALSLVGRFNDWMPDVVITACPMLAQVTWQHWAYGSSAVPNLVVVQDSMAHAATELGIIRSGALGDMLHRFERWSLEAADVISTISPGMKSRVESIVAGTAPVTVVPNWIHSSIAECIANRRSNGVPVRTRRSLFYSGNFGVKQGLPGFLTMFGEVRGEWTIQINGNGAEAEHLSRSVGGLGSWLTLGELQPELAYVNSLLSASACVITQMGGVGANFLPSKLLPALAAGTPVLGVCEQDSPLGEEIRLGGFGEVVEPNDRIALASVLAKWSQTPTLLEEYSLKALQRSQYYRAEHVLPRYERLLEELARTYRLDQI